MIVQEIQGCVAFSKNNSNAEYYILYFYHCVVVPLKIATMTSKAACQLRGISCGGFRGYFSASS